MKTMLNYIMLLAGLVMPYLCVAGNTEVVEPTNGAATWHIDQANSTVLLKVNHSSLLDLYGFIPGRAISGATIIDDGDFTQSTWNLIFQASEISATFEFPFQMLKGEGSLDMDKYPEIRFSSRKIVLQDGVYKVIGPLSMNGVTKEISFDIEHASDIISYEGFKFRAYEANSIINRQDFGITWQEPEKLNHPLFSDEIHIKLVLEVVNPKPEPMPAPQE